MLADFVTLGVVQSRTHNRFAIDVPTGAKVRRADREHRPLPRAAFALAMRALARAQTRHTLLGSCTTSGEPGMNRVAE